MSVFKKTTVSHLDQPLFLGEEVDVARYDELKYPWLDKLTERQLSFFWRPDEVDLSRDRIDFNERMDDNERHIFTSNLKYQILLDSVQGRGPNLAFLSICSLPEFETWVETWAFSETIHSRSYTHIIRNVYTNPSEVLDTIVTTPEILERATSVTEKYDELIAMNYPLHLLHGTRKHKEAIFDTLVAVNVLEAVRFYVSFACSFAFAERKLMEGNSKVIKLIARDEALHLSGTQLLIQHMLHGMEGDEWQEIAINRLDVMFGMFDAAVEQEKAWAAYLFQDGSMIGLNTPILHQYIEYIANVRIRALGFDNRYETTRDPLPWMQAYLTNDNVQVAPQETEISSYLTGAIDTNVEEDAFKGLSL